MLRANLAPRCGGDDGANVMGRMGWDGGGRDRAATPVRPQVDDAVPSQVNRAKSCAISRRARARRYPKTVECHTMMQAKDLHPIALRPFATQSQCQTRVQSVVNTPQTRQTARQTARQSTKNFVLRLSCFRCSQTTCKRARYYLANSPTM